MGEWALLYKDSVYILLFRNTVVAHSEGDWRKELA